VPQRTRVGLTAPEGASGESLRLEDLSPGARLVVRTETAAYDLTIISPSLRQVVVCGGTYVPRPLGAHVDGCSSEGRFLEVGAIRVGCSVELRTGTGVIVTSPVRSVGFVHHT
jgi:hypothetical protein